MNIYFVNSYSMLEVFERFKASTIQEHHLWGLSRIPERHSVRFAKGTRINWIEVLLGKHGWRLYTLRRQFVEFFRCRRSDDLAYFGSYHAFPLQGLLNRVFRPRLVTVCLLHYPVFGIHTFLLSQFSHVLTLTQDAQALCDDVLPINQSNYIGWAVDGAFYDYLPAPNDGQPVVLAAGKDRRDYNTLLQGFEASLTKSLKLRIISSKWAYKPSPSSRVNVSAGGQDVNAVQESELKKEYQSCLAVAIPLKDTVRVAGLTSLLDAVGAGRMVLCTKNAGIDYDIEGLGIGRWLEIDDVEGWAKAFAWLEQHPEVAREAGRRAREFGRTELGIESYCSKVVASLEAIQESRRCVERKGRLAR